MWKGIKLCNPEGLICTQITELNSLYVSKTNQVCLTGNLTKEDITVVSTRGALSDHRTEVTGP